MRRTLVAKEAVAVLATVLLLVLLSVPLGRLPPLGDLLNPSGGIWSVPANARLPPKTELTTAGLDGTVTVDRDVWGVPHIFATTDHDLFFALGFVHAQDRLWQMDIQYRFAAGRLSEVLGPAAVETDTLLRTVGLYRIGAAAVAGATPGAVDDVALRAYSDGVNAYLSHLSPRDYPLEFKLLDYPPEPWTPEKTATSGALIAFSLSADFSDIDRGLFLDAFGDAAFEELFPVRPPFEVPIVPVPASTRPAARISESRIDATAARDLLRRASLLGPYRFDPSAFGSNNWVVGPARSASGKPILAGDPHLRFQLPAVWYEVQLHGGSYDVYGVTFPGLPPVFIGHNRYLAWSETNTGADVTDFYRETTDAAAHPGQYRFRGEWLPFMVHHETIRVRGSADLPVEVQESVHGPILTERGETVAMKWSGSQFRSELSAALSWMKARTWPEFRYALRQWANPAQNFAVAAVDGTFAIRSNGFFPIRNNTLGRVPLDGASGDFEWTGSVPFDAYPEAVNASQGFLASANQLPAAENYPYYLGSSWDDGYRARRINELLNGSADPSLVTNKLTLADMQRFQLDTVDVAAAAFRPFILEATDVQSGSCIPCYEGRDLLAGWNLTMSEDSAGAAIWATFVSQYVDGIFGDEWAARGLSDLPKPQLNVVEDLTRSSPSSPWFDDVRTPRKESRDDIIRTAWEEALSTLSTKFGAGPTTWRWGDLHARQFDHLTGLEPLSRGPFPSGGSGATLNVAGGLVSRHGPSWRMVIDMADPAGAFGTYPGGQSGNVMSVHYDDLLGMWLLGDYHELIFPATEAAMAGFAVESALVLRGG